MKAPSCLLCFVLAIFLPIPGSGFAAGSATPPPGVPSDPAGDPGDQAARPATVVIPGPLRSFLRMAGISQKISAEEVMPLLAHNVFSQGYEGWQEKGRPTEFLILLNRYVRQARELALLADPDGVIRVSTCDQAKPLLHVLGFGLRSDCGHPGTFLAASDAERAFLTTDSGFPLPELEEALQNFDKGGKPFAYPFRCYSWRTTGSRPARKTPEVARTCWTPSSATL
jgi:hypothetical protein